MGLLTFLGIVTATSAVSKIASKSAEEKRKAEESRLELEKAQKIAEQQARNQRALAIEAEKTRRTIAMQEAEHKKILAAQQAIALHKQELERIRQKRIDNPINITCPRCTAPRIVSRMNGTIICEYCDFKEPLPDFHLYNRELDEVRIPQPVPQPAPNNTPLSAKAHMQTFSQKVNATFPQAQNKIDSFVLTSLILSVVSFLLCCGTLVIPQVVGLIFGIVPLLNKNKKLNTTNIVLAILAISLNGILILFAIFSYSGALIDKTTNDSSTDDLSSSSSYSFSSDYETTTEEITDTFEIQNEHTTVSVT